MVAADIALTRGDEWDVLYFRFSPSKKIASAIRSKKCLKVIEINGLEYFDHKNSDDIIDSFDIMLVETPRIAEGLGKLYGDRIKVISHVTPGVDVDMFAPLDMQLARERVGWEAQGEICLWVSGYQAHQDIESLVLSARDAILARPGVQFVFIGDGPRKEEVIRLIEKFDLGDSIRLIDYVRHDALADYISASNVCINLQYKCVLEESNHRAFKIYEYASCARPIIDSVNFGLPVFEWLRPSARFVEPENHADVSAAIVDILDRNDHWLRRAMETREFVARHRSWRAVTAATMRGIREAGISH